LEERLQRNSVKEQLQAGGCAYGTSVEDNLDPEIAVLLAAAGLDFFFIDTEHCTASPGQIQGLCRVARGAGIIPLVRVTQNEPDLISRALDVGAMGIIVPRVHSPEQARAALDIMKFPPLGHRGFGLRSIVTDFRAGSVQDETESANRETLTVLMIESKAGLDAVEAIAQTPNLDVLFIGPFDLTLSLSIVGQFDNPIFHKALGRIIAACEKAGIAAGLQSGDMDVVLKARSMGARFLMYGSDTALLFSAFRDAVAKLKSIPADRRVSY
jgi:2-keto-3-deoxy-L-rhamnonate aldolase RhmA